MSITDLRFNEKKNIGEIYSEESHEFKSQQSSVGLFSENHFERWFPWRSLELWLLLRLFLNLRIGENEIIAINNERIASQASQLQIT